MMKHTYIYFFVFASTNTLGGKYIILFYHLIKKLFKKGNNNVDGNVKKIINKIYILGRISC